MNLHLLGGLILGGLAILGLMLAGGAGGSR